MRPIALLCLVATLSACATTAPATKAPAPVRPDVLTLDPGPLDALVAEALTPTDGSYLVRARSAALLRGDVVGPILHMLQGDVARRYEAFRQAIGRDPLTVVRYLGLSARSYERADTSIIRTRAAIQSLLYAVSGSRREPSVRGATTSTRSAPSPKRAIKPRLIAALSFRQAS